MTIQLEQAAILRKLAEQFDGRRLCNWVPGVDWPMSIQADEATLAALDAGAAALSRQREQDDHGAAAVQAIEQFAAGWDESGLVGIREPYRWETVARACLDVLRSIAVRHIAIHGVQPLAVQPSAALSQPSRQLVDGYDATFWNESYKLLRDAVMEHLAQFVHDDDAAEEGIIVKAIKDAGAALVPQGCQTCEWSNPNIDGVYRSACGMSFAFGDSSRAIENFTFCPKCGKRVIEPDPPQEK